MAKKADINKVNRYREMLKRGLITDAQLQKLVSLNVITEEEYQLIIAEPNK